VNKAVRSELHWFQISHAGLLITVNIHWSSRFIHSCSVTVRDTLQTQTGAQCSYSNIHHPTHCLCDKQTQFEHIKKGKIKETIFLPSVGCLIRNKSTYYELLKARTQHGEISLWLTYSTYHNPEERVYQPYSNNIHQQYNTVNIPREKVIIEFVQKVKFRVSIISRLLVFYIILVYLTLEVILLV
jgi:hypothetical protein